MTLSTIYHFPIDGQGNETGEALPITLNADGAADVSKLPIDLRETLESFGTPDELRTDRLFPSDGERFLNSLLANTSGYRRFRTNPNPKS